MYHDTTRETVIKTYRLPENYSIDAAVLLGIWNPEQAMMRWREHFTDVHQPAPFHNLFFGQRDGRHIGFGVAYGPTFAADVARFCQLMGARKLIQIGFYGGLQPNMKRADFIVPTEAIRGDGASDAYLPRETQVFASTTLSDHLAAMLTESGATVHRLPQISIVGGILSETREHIADWSGRGYGGVDLETATTFAIAHRYGLECAAMLLCSDVVVEGDTLFHAHADEEARERYERHRLLMEEIALNAAIQ